MSRNRLSNGATVGRTFKLPEELDRRLHARAVLTGRAVGALIRDAIVAYLLTFEK